VILNTLIVAMVFVLTAPYAMADMLGVSIDTSGMAGKNVKAVFDMTVNTPYLNYLYILNFFAPGSTMGLPETSGGLVDGDLILRQNPAPFTVIEGSTFFNELIVNLTPVSNQITFDLSYSNNGPSAGAAPDQISFFLLDGQYQPLFPTADPLGTDALFAVDLTGSSSVDVYSPATLTSPGNIQITVPGSTTVPEPKIFLLTLPAAILIALRRYTSRRSQQ
jgi:hypothetical protein